MWKSLFSVANLINFHIINQLVQFCSNISSDASSRAIEQDRPIFSWNVGTRTKNRNFSVWNKFCVLFLMYLRMAAYQVKHWCRFFVAYKAIVEQKWIAICFINCKKIYFFLLDCCYNLVYWPTFTQIKILLPFANT